MDVTEKAELFFLILSEISTFCYFNKNIRPDMYKKCSFIIWFFRLAHTIDNWKVTRPVLTLIGHPVILLYRLVVEWILGVEIPPSLSAGKGLKIFHGAGLVVHPLTKIGNNVTLRQNTTIGTIRLKNGKVSKAPVLCDGVDVGANAVIIGPITIGKNAIIGAGAVVTKDVFPGTTVVGNPAKPIEEIPE
jgi:putative colanic acid biosynthesis acetyltransferase WcaB